MSRSLEGSNAQHKKASKRLPLGVASNFRYWGEDKTIYLKRDGSDIGVSLIEPIMPVVGRRGSNPHKN